MIDPNVLVVKYPPTEYKLEGYYDPYADKSGGEMTIHVVSLEGEDVGDLDVPAHGMSSEEAAERIFQEILPEYGHVWRSIVDR